MAGPGTGGPPVASRGLSRKAVSGGPWSSRIVVFRIVVSRIVVSRMVLFDSTLKRCLVSSPTRVLFFFIRRLQCHATFRRVDLPLVFGAHSLVELRFFLQTGPLLGRTSERY